MRYIAILMTGLMLMACNLSSPGTQTNSDTSTPEQTGNITYWQTMPTTQVVQEEGDIILLDSIILRRIESDSPYTGDTAADLEQALELAINSPNVWFTDNLLIESVSISGDQASLRLNGDIQGAGDVLLIIARQQLLLTVFEDSRINAVLMQVNGDNIGNLGISHPSQAVDADYIETREAFFSSEGIMP